MPSILNRQVKHTQYLSCEDPHLGVEGISRTQYTLRAMKAIILCAGNTARLSFSPKGTASALLPIKGKPIIEYIVNKLQDIKELNEIIVVSSSRFYKQFQMWADKYVLRQPLTVVNIEREKTACAGAIVDLVDVLKQQGINDDILVVGGDNLFSFMLDGFIDFAYRCYPQNVIGAYYLNGNLKPKKYGLMKLNETGAVIDFCEKPLVLNGLRLASICIYFFPREKLYRLYEYKNQAPKSHTIGSYIEWLTRKEQVSGYEFEGLWFDIADEDSYAEAVCTF